MLDGLARSRGGPTSDELRAEPGLSLQIFWYNAVVLSADVLAEAVPGNIRRSGCCSYFLDLTFSEHFVNFLRRFVEYLKVLTLFFVCTNQFFPDSLAY